MSEELKPCPFCGNEEPYIDGFGGFVKCGTCKSSTQTKAISVQGEGQVESLLPRKEAIKAWNTRAKPTFTKEDVEKAEHHIYCELLSWFGNDRNFDEDMAKDLAKAALNAIGKIEE